LRISIRRFIQSDDAAYLSPMAAFLLLTWVGGNWPGLYPASYVAKTLAAAALLIYFRNYYTKIRWNHWWLGIIVGIIGVVQWVGMEKAILHFWPHYFRPSVEVWNPYEHFQSAQTMWAFIIIRWMGASLVVPFMEELFWRSFIMRWIDRTNFLQLSPASISIKALVVSTLLFGVEHHLWAAGIVAGLAYGWLYMRAGNLWVPITAHAVTNLLLGVWVLWTGRWEFW